MTGLFLALTSALVLGAASPQAPSPYLAAQHLAKLPDGRRMNIYCTGHGEPTIVLEGGWTTETSYWRAVQPVLARRSRVCSYDRAGYGFSDPGPMPRTAAAMEQDFAQLMDAAAIRGPIILVAHSIGSFPARLYAEHHPARVAALILLDPPTEDDRPLYSAIRPDADPKVGFIDPALACSAAILTNPTAMPDPPICVGSPDPAMPDAFNKARAAMQKAAPYQRTAASEIREMYGASADQVRASRRPLGSIPVVILTAGESSTDPAYSASDNTAMRRAQWKSQGRIANLSSRPVHHLLAGASHFIPREHPEAVVAAVEEAERLLRSSPHSMHGAGHSSPRSLPAGRISSREGS